MLMKNRLEPLKINERCKVIDPFTSKGPVVGIIASDSEKYILKFKRVNRSEDTSLMQEYLGYRICEELNVSVPSFNVINVTEEDILEMRNDDNHDIDKRFKNIEKDCGAIAPEPYFGSKFLECPTNIEVCFSNSDSKKLNKIFKNVENNEIYAESIAIACLLGNKDQLVNAQNFLFTSDKNNIKVYITDFGNSFFSSMWDSNKASLFNKLIEDQDQFVKNFEHLLFENIEGNTQGDATFKAIKSSIFFKDANPFASIVNRIENISEDFIQKTLEEIPQEWFVNRDEQIKAYKTFLNLHKMNVRQILNDYYRSDSFDNYIDKSLKWL